MSTREPRPEADGYGERVGAAVRQAVAEVEAPQRLREALAGAAPVRARRRRVLAPLAGASLLAATVVALVLALGASTGSPALTEVAVASLQPPTAGVPGDAPADPGFLDVGVGSVRFPTAAGYELTWRPVGVRRDRVDGRRAVTVIYRSTAGGLHYTIVDGQPLAVPAEAERVPVPGRDGRFEALRADGAQIVTWERDGRTCILTSREVSRDDLLTFFAPTHDE